MRLSCYCSQICHNIVKVAVDPWGDTADYYDNYYDNVMTKFNVNNRTDALKLTSICFLQ